MAKPAGESRVRDVLDIVATMALIVASGVIIWVATRPREASATVAATPKARAEIPVPAEPVEWKGAIVKGRLGARVGVMEFSEFQCPFCARFATDSLPVILRKYVDAGLVGLAFRHLPLERIHPYAFGAAELAQCASDQGRFWEVHNAFFTQPSATSAGEFMNRALVVGLKKADIDRCIKSGTAGERVKADVKAAESLRLTSTPAFLIGTLTGDGLRVQKIVLGARPVADFEKVIDGLLGQIRAESEKQ